MNNICNELTSLSKKYIVINENTQIEIFYDVKIEKNTVLKINDIEIRINDISAIWVRKGNYFKSQIYSYTNPYLSYFMNKELEVYLDYFEFTFADKFKLSRPNLRNFNKLKFLSKAKKFSIRIPNSFIVNSRQKLKILLNSYPKLVTKPLSDIINPQSNISMYTKVVDENNYKSLPNYFFPSLFQEQIESIYEIRTVYLLDKTYSGVLFPHYIKESEPDFRSNPNLDLGLSRINLPNEFENKIKRFMNYLDIQFCSLDILVNENMNYFIIDLNPFGQFGMISHLFDNEIEHIIATYL